MPLEARYHGMATVRQGVGLVIIDSLRYGGPGRWPAPEASAGQRPTSRLVGLKIVVLCSQSDMSVHLKQGLNDRVFDLNGPNQHS